MWLRKICIICAFLVVNTQDVGEDGKISNENFEITEANENLDIAIFNGNFDSAISNENLDNGTSSENLGNATSNENLDNATSNENLDNANSNEILENATSNENLDSTISNSNDTVNEKKLSDTVLALIEHFKQPDPVGLPGDIVPDPSPVPDSSQSVAFGVMMYFKDSRMYGVSKFRILYINVDIQRMQVEGALKLAALQTSGNYTLSSWFDTLHGTYTVNMTGLNVTATTNLGVRTDGQLQVEDVHMDLELETINTDFENIGVVGSMFQTAMNSGTSMFDSMKPYMLRDIYKNFRKDVNAQLDTFFDEMQFPNTIPAIDMVIINVREKIRELRLDPYRIEESNTTYSPITFSLSNTWITGLSTFYRVGNVTLRIENNTAVTEFEIGTKVLEGSTQWAISSIGGIISMDGTASFSVDYIGAKIIVSQPLDTRKSPIFKDLQLDIGNIQARCDGLGTLDYIIELAVNILPNLLRYQIFGAIEGPLKEMVQEELNYIDVEETIKSELPKLDEMQNVKISDLIRTNMEQKVFDEDEFFNF